MGTDEILEVVLAFMPDIIHFSGHGEPGRSQFENAGLPGATLARIVAQVPQIWCVVLNSCFGDSISQQLLVAGVPAVVGMTGEVSDYAALDFSRFFYRALAESPDIVRAVEQSRINLQATFPDEEPAPVLRLGESGLLAERSQRHARAELRARFCVDHTGIPEVWRKGGSVYVSFDLYIKNAPLSASSVIYRLDRSYDEISESNEDGKFREIQDATDAFYLGGIDSEDDFTVEAYIRWNDGRVKMLACKVTDALVAHYSSLSPEEAVDERVDTAAINRIIVGLRHENIPLDTPLDRPVPMRRRLKGKQARRVKRR